MNHADAKELAEGCERLQIALAPDQLAELLRYRDELAQWNAAYNLTAVREPQAMIARHLLDSLAIVPFVAGESLLDVGAGPGLPSIPLAIAKPQLAVTALDSNVKKARFMRHAARTLGLENFEVVHARVDEYRADGFGTIVARAFAPPAELLSQVRHLCGPDTRVLAMLGRREAAQQTAPGFELHTLEAVSVPGTDAQRHIAIYLVKA